MSDQLPTNHHRLRARRLGIETQQEAIILMRRDCPVCRSEGFSAHARVRVSHGDRSVIATLFQVTSDLLQENEVALSESAWRRLCLSNGDPLQVSHPAPVRSMSPVRGKIYGQRFRSEDLGEIVADIAAGRYSDIDLSAFITACSAQELDHDETVALTGAMVDVGDRLQWAVQPVADKHSVGGLPGNRTTPIVVAVVAACGVTIPKTSSRAITSPSGTADAMETLAPVALDLAAMRRVVEAEGGCVVWGGAVQLSPVDDMLIRVERALDIDSEGQLIASVLSKKIAAGATHLVIDMPVGPTAKVRGSAAAAVLSQSLSDVAGVFGLRARIIQGDGRQPVGRCIGPALEAQDVLRVLRNDADAPDDLRQRALELAGALLELAGRADEGAAVAMARSVLADGRAWRKFQAICEAQGGMREPPAAPQTKPVLARQSGTVTAIDNRRIARIAKLAGAPEDKAAGMELHVRLGDTIAAGEPLYTIHSESLGELTYAEDYASANPDVIRIGDNGQPTAG